MYVCMNFNQYFVLANMNCTFHRASQHFAKELMVIVKIQNICQCYMIVLMMGIMSYYVAKTFVGYELVTTQGESTTLAIPIPSLTPLATSSEIPGLERVNVDYLTPIELEEMTSLDFFFTKKRKAIV
jgi:hypothetical protein